MTRTLGRDFAAAGRDSPRFDLVCRRLHAAYRPPQNHAVCGVAAGSCLHYYHSRSCRLPTNPAGAIRRPTQPTNRSSRFITLAAWLRACRIISSTCFPGKQQHLVCVTIDAASCCLRRRRLRLPYVYSAVTWTPHNAPRRKIPTNCPYSCR